ncbi:hypothetical protein VTO73DRAFT_10616 [Trametes versicolor]
MARYFDSHTADQAIWEDINDLCKNIDCIIALFDKVMYFLQNLDHESPDAKTALALQWLAFRKRFYHCLDDSRNSATAVSEVLLNDKLVLKQNKTIEQNITNLRHEAGMFQESFKEPFVSVKAVQCSFNELYVEIRHFLNVKVKLSIQSKGTGGSLLVRPRNVFEDLLAVSKEKVANIPVELLDQSDIDSDFLERVATLVPGISKTLRMLSPTMAYDVLRDIHTEERVGAQMELVRGTVSIDIGDVARRITGIANIWKHLRLDMTQIDMLTELIRDKLSSSSDLALCYPFVFSLIDDHSAMLMKSHRYFEVLLIRLSLPVSRPPTPQNDAGHDDYSPVEFTELTGFQVEMIGKDAMATFEQILKDIGKELNLIDHIGGFTGTAGLTPRWMIYNKRVKLLFGHITHIVLETRKIMNDGGAETPMPTGSVVGNRVTPDRTDSEELQANEHSKPDHETRTTTVTTAVGIRYLARTFLKFVANIEHSVELRMKLLDLPQNTEGSLKEITLPDTSEVTLP